MKIIQPGIVQQQTLENGLEKYWWLDFTFKCKQCFCLFSLERSDFPKLIKINKNCSHITNIITEDITLNCPFCNYKICSSKPIPKPPNGPVNRSIVEEPEKFLFPEIFDKGGIFEQIFGPRKNK